MAGVRTAGRTVVGLDIEPGFIAAVRVRPDGEQRVAIERAAGAALTPGIVRDGEVADVDALAEALRELFRAHKLGRRVRIGVANQRIVVRTVDLPPLGSEKEIAAAVRFHAQDHIPMPLEQAVLEHQSLGIVETAEGQRTRVVLVAARRDMIERLYSAARQAGLRPVGIDLAAFAMIRALHRGGTGATLYLSVGGMTNLALAEGTTCVFTRVVPGGVEALAAELAERRGLTLEHARQWLTHVGLVTTLEALSGEPAIVEEARSVLTEGVRRIGDEVRNSLDYYRAQAGALAAEQAILTGPAAMIPGFAEALGRAIGMSVEIGLVEEAREGGLGGLDAGRVAVAAGLALDDATASDTSAAAVATAVELEVAPEPVYEPAPAAFDAAPDPPVAYEPAPAPPAAFDPFAAAVPEPEPEAQSEPEPALEPEAAYEPAPAPPAPAFDPFAAAEPEPAEPAALEPQPEPADSDPADSDPADPDPDSEDEPA